MILDSSKEMARIAIDALEDKKAEDIKIIDISVFGIIFKSVKIFKFVTYTAMD